MLAKLVATKIISGDYSSDRVPRLLKDEVNKHLKEMGHPELAID